MTTYPGNEFDIDVNFYLSETLLNEGYFEVLATLLAELVPDWASKLHIWRGKGEDNTPLDISDPTTIYMPIRSALLERGPTYYKLLKQEGITPKPRNNGSIEIRGKDSSLNLVVGVDDHVLWPIAGKYKWGNYISFHASKTTLEKGQKTHKLISEIFFYLCERLPIVYAHAQCSAEYFNKNVDSSNGGRKAIGIDFSRSLPGIYWLNYFGKPYVEFIGKGNLLKADAYEVKEIGDSISVQISQYPQQWNEREYQKTESTVLNNIGNQYFFSRLDPDRKTIAPEFDLPKPNFPNRGPLQVLHDEKTGKFKVIGKDGKLTDI